MGYAKVGNYNVEQQENKLQTTNKAANVSLVFALGTGWRAAGLRLPVVWLTLGSQQLRSSNGARPRLDSRHSITEPGWTGLLDSLDGKV